MICHHEKVRPEWIDYNGHLSEPYYVLVFGHATDVLMDHVGLDAAYRDETGCSLYTVEAHLRYLREVGDGQEVTVLTRVVDADDKRVHLAHEMSVADRLVATEELLGVHVDSLAGRSAPLPAGTRTVLSRLVEQPPDYARRAISLHRDHSRQ